MRLIYSARRVLGLIRRRAVPPPGPKPRLGAKIVFGDLRITVQAGLTDNAWRWLTAAGWREQTYARDRRTYRDVPPSRVADLFDAHDPDEFRQLMSLAAAEATWRPSVSLGRRR